MINSIDDNIELGEWLAGNVLTKLGVIIELFREYANSVFVKENISASLRSCGVLNKEDLCRFIDTLSVVHQDFEVEWVSSSELLSVQNKVTPLKVIEGIEEMMRGFSRDDAQGHLYAYFVCMVFKASIAQKLAVKWQSLLGEDNVFFKLKMDIADYLYAHNLMQVEIQTTKAVLNEDQQVVFDILKYLEKGYKVLLSRNRMDPALVRGYVSSTVTDGADKGAFDEDEMRRFQELERKQREDAELLRRQDEILRQQAAERRARDMLVQSNQSPAPQKKNVGSPERGGLFVHGKNVGFFVSGSGAGDGSKEWVRVGPDADAKIENGHNWHLGKPDEKSLLLSGKGGKLGQIQDDPSAHDVVADVAKTGCCCTLL
ncbi:MAG: hypothetical protein KAS93_03385 [Gammaproteobacteria bacterium]|nr:hypothetical protein [Gammaproteobacteria bacterium]